MARCRSNAHIWGGAQINAHRLGRDIYERRSVPPFLPCLRAGCAQLTCNAHRRCSQCAPSAHRFCAVGMPWAGPMCAFGAPAERRLSPPLRGPDWTGFDTPTDRLGRCGADLMGLAPSGLQIPSTWSTMTAPRLALRPADHQQTYY